MSKIMEPHEIIARTDHHAVIDQSKRHGLIRFSRAAAHLEGNMAELGVYKGGSALVLALAVPSKPLYLYDTFEGLPSDDVGEHTHHKGDFTARLEDVQNLLQGQNVIFRVGYFPSTAVDTSYCCVHIDGDLYTTTRDAIQFFWPRLVPGGYLIFDDWLWGHCPGVERAIREAGLSVEESAKFQCVAQKPAL
jgi:hypothetical protein